MESLALLVFVIFSAVFLCGPIAVGMAYLKWTLPALLIGGLAIWLGVYWFATVYTAAKYLGVVSALLGLWALLKATGDMFPWTK